MPKDPHAVLIRPLATGRWEVLEYATSAMVAVAKASKQRRKGLSHGDLILAIDIAEISAIQERGECLYFVDKAYGVTRAPPVPIKQTWFLEWEGPWASAAEMLYLCHKLDRKTLVATACAIARVTLPHVPTGENRPRIAIETAEAWARNKVKYNQVQKAQNDAKFYADSLPSHIAAIAAEAAYLASEVNDSRMAEYVAKFASRAMSGNCEDNLRQLSHIVREYIPLHVVLESRI